MNQLTKEALDSRSLWDALHSNNYLDASNTQLNLPAQNQLGSPAIQALLQETALFASSSLVMSLSATSHDERIVLSGTLSGSFLGATNPAAVATFWLDEQQVAQLTVAVSMPKGYRLLSSFGTLQDSFAGEQVFASTTLTASSTSPAQTLGFAGVPSLHASIVKLWGNASPGAMTGSITLPAAAGENPRFTLQSPPTLANFGAGLAPLTVQLQLAASASGSPRAQVLGQVNVDQDWPSVALSMPLPVPGYPLPVLGAGPQLAQPLTDLMQLAPLFMGQALANLIPARFPIGNAFTLTDLQVGLSADCGSLQSLQLSVTANVGLSLLPGNLAELEQVGITFFAGSGKGSPIHVIFNGLFALANNPQLAFIASFSLPDCLVVANNVKPIDVGALLDSFWPGLQAPRNDLTISVLSATLSPITSTYSFNGEVVLGSSWSLDVGRGVTALALDQVSFSATRSSAALALEFGAQLTLFDSLFYLTASTPGQGQGWVFSGQMSANTPLKLTTVASTLLPFVPSGYVPDIEVTYLLGSFDTALSTYQIAAGLEWRLDMIPVTIDADFLLQSQRSAPGATPTFSGYVKGRLDINNLVLEVAYIFSPTSSDIVFKYRQLTVDWHRDPTDPYVAISLNASTLGDLFSFLISFADPGNDFRLPAPWDALEKISLPNLTVKVHLQTKEIDVELAMSIDLGFIDIRKFGLSYTRTYGEPNLNIQLYGTFLGQDYTKSPLGWDMLNEPAPAVPGSGTQIFDLEYFGIGQHLAIRGTQPASMDAVIAALENALQPVGNPSQNPSSQLPGLTFDAGSNWLIGTRFTVMSTVELSVIFNDPNLYGLLVQLSGGKAGSLAGLRFEILYRKISDSVGVYHIELTLPDAMRHLEFGEVSVTLPIVTIDIYTNGNFRVDCGFPPSLTDFSRSFSVQVFPFIGYGGFYFAVLNGQTSTQVPRVDSGNFSPVLEFGFALQVGVGKSISVGILSGGISITVGGMLQGVLAWYEPNQQNLPAERFYKMVGTVAIIGQVSAEVNFGIIQAGVSLIVYASATLNLECYKALLIQVSASVQVRVSIKILFIRIHFSFGATITESFVIGSDSTPPWHLIQGSGGTPGGQTLRGSYRSRALLARPIPHSALRQREPRRLSTRRPLRLVRAAANSVVQVEVTVIPLISQALCSDFGFPGGPTPPTGTVTPVLATLLGLPTSTDPSSSANQLLAILLDWALGAIGHEHDAVSSAVIAEILDALNQPDAADSYFAYPDLTRFFTDNNIVFTLVPRPTAGNPSAPVDMAFMAMIPEVTLDAPGYSIDFSVDRTPVGDYENTVQAYFAQLASQYAERQRGAPRAADTLSDNLARFVFRNYFLMLTRGAVRSAQDALNAATYRVADNLSTLTSIANSFNNDYSIRSGDSIASIAAMFSLSSAQIEAANPDLDFTALAVGQTVFVPASPVAYLVQNGDSGAALAACFGLALADLQAANPSVNFDALQPGTPLGIPALRVAHTSLPGQTAQAIASEFGLSLQALLAANPSTTLNPLAAGTAVLIPLRVQPLAIAVANQGSAALLAAKGTMSLGDIPMLAAASDSLSGIATRFGIDCSALLAANQGSLELLQSGQSIVLGNLTTSTRNGDSLNGLAAYWALSADAIAAANSSLALDPAQQALVIPLPSGNLSYPVKAGDTVASVLATYSAQGITLDQLVQNNTLVLSSAQSVALPAVTHVTSASYFQPYTVTTGDSVASIAAAFFPADRQDAAVAAINQWNSSFAVGSLIQIPYASSLGNISRVYRIDLPTLALNAAIGQPSLLAPHAALSVPQVVYCVQDGDTLASIGQNYGLSIEQLCERIATTPGLLAQGQVKVPAVPAIKLATLSALLASGGGFTQAANMASRFMLNGLRLPAPQFSNLPPPPADATYPLYALVGQEFPVSAPLASDYRLTFTPTAEWVQGTLSMPLTADEIQRVQDFSSLSLQTGVLPAQVQPVALYAYVADRQPVGQSQPWHTADLPDGLAVAGQKLGQPALWPLPESLQQAVAASPQRALPYRAVYNEQQADGSVSTTALTATRWATTIDIRVQQLPVAQPGNYLMLGADQNGSARLLAVWAHLAANQGSATLYLAYAEQANNGSGAMVTDLLDRSASFLLKTNLSTETHGEPPVRLKSARTVTRLSSPPGALPSTTLAAADSVRFLELLWECSVVNSGGFYLRYVTADGRFGLPDTLFQSGRQATLRLIVVLDEQTTGNPELLAINNAMLVGDNIDTGAADLGFEAVTHTVAAGDSLTSIAAAYPQLALDAPTLAGINQDILGLLPVGASLAGQTAGPDDTLASIASRAGLSVTDLGIQIAGDSAVLMPGALMQLAGKPVQPVRAGDSLASICEEYDFLDPAALASLNATASALLAVGASLAVPGQAAHVIATGDSFASIAQTTGVDVSMLGEANADAPILSVGSSIRVAGNTLRMNASLPPGHVGFSVVRANPQPADLGQETAQQALDTLFNLLGYQVGGNAFFAASHTDGGLPAGPTNSDEGAPWNYRQTLALFRLGTTNECSTSPALPPAAANPYAGLAANAEAQLQLGFLDILGNSTAGASLGQVTVESGYTDELIPLAAWPGIQKSYRLYLANAIPTLALALSLSPARYLPSGGLSAASSTQSASQDLAKYQAISYQLQQQDVDCYLSTSLGSLANPQGVGLSARMGLLGISNAAYVFLRQAAALQGIAALTGSSGYASLAALLDSAAAQPGYPLSYNDLGQANATARADLLFGQGASLAIPLNALVRSGDTASAIALGNDSSVATLADNNAAVLLAGGTALATAVRSYQVPNGAALCLQAIAQALSAPLLDAPGEVPGLIGSNAGVALASGMTLTYGATSAVTQSGDTLTHVAAALQQRLGTPVSAADVAMANRYLDGLFAAGTVLSVASYITTASDTLAGLASSYGPPAGQSGTPLQQFLLGNQSVPGLWPVGAALYIKAGSHNVAEGETLSDVAAVGATSVAVLLAANSGLPLADNGSLAIPGLADCSAFDWSIYQADGSETLNGIVGKYSGWTLERLATLNQDVPGLLAATPIVLGGTSVTPTLTSTLASLAQAFGLAVGAFAAQIASLPQLVWRGANFVAPAMQVQPGETLAQCAARLNLSPASLVSANACLPGLLPAGQSLTLLGTTYGTLPNDSFALFTARINSALVADQQAPLGVGDVGTLAAGFTLSPRHLLSAPRGAALLAQLTPSYAQAIQALTVSLAISRDPARVAPAFRNAPRVISAMTPIPAAAQSDDAGNLSLAQFATDFETAFPGLKLATGPRQTQGAAQLAKPSLKAALSSAGGAGSSGRGLWVVNFSGQGNAVAYALQGESPRYFALPPLTTSAWNGSDIPVPTYDSSAGLQWPAGTTRNFQAVDPDQWQQTFLAAVDQLLQPDYAVPGMTDSSISANLATLLTAKSALASSIAGTLAPIVGTDGTGQTEAQEAFTQQLLVALGAAYRTQSLVQFPVAISGSGAGSDPTTAPRISGQLVSNIVTTYADDDPAHKTDPAHPLAILAGQCGVATVYLANVIQDLPRIIRAPVSVSFAGGSYVTQAADTLASIASQFGTDAATLAASLTIASGDVALFLGSTAINVTPAAAPATLTGLNDVADWLVATVADVLLANSERTDFFAAGTPVRAGTIAVTPTGTQTLADVAAAFGGLNSLAELLTQVDSGALNGGYTLNPAAPPRALQLVPQLAFTTAKAALAAGGSQLTALLSVKDPAARKSVLLDLDYRINQLEFDVHTVAGIAGYQSSSWLNFVIPLVQGRNTSGTVGQVQIPIPLNNYPSPVVITGQSAGAAWPGDPEATLTQWTYGFSSVRQMAAQDQVTLELRFNSPGSGPNTPQAAPPVAPHEAIIRALAAFSAVWPAIAADLAQLPDTPPGGPATPAVRHAAAALAQLAENVQNAWQLRQVLAVGGGSEADFTYSLSALTQGSPPYISALLLDRVGQNGSSDSPDDFIFSADAAFAEGLDGGSVPSALASLFGDYGFPLSDSSQLRTNAPGQDWSLVDEAARQQTDTQGTRIEAPQTYRLRVVQPLADGPSSLAVYRQLLWPALRLAGASTWQDLLQSGNRLVMSLPAKQQPLTQPLALDVDFYRMNLLLRQNGWGGSFISRNANLIQGATINSAFVYRTPLSMFPTKITPYVQENSALALPGASLADALAAFFTRLLSAQAVVQPQSSRNLRISASYVQAIDGVSDPTRTPLTFTVPLLLLPLYPFAVSTDSGDFCESLAATVRAAADNAGIPAVSAGLYRFDVVVYNMLTEASQGAPQPLLEASQLHFPRR